LIEVYNAVAMERLNSLQREFEENAKQLANPVDFADLEHLKERREVILREARLVAQELEISGPHWFSIGV
jgi:hypothetical protein